MNDKEKDEFEADLIFDCIMRLMANRSYQFSLSATFAVIQTIASEMPTNGRELVQAELDKLKQCISDMPINEPAKAY